MAISRITASGVATDTLTAADIADDAIGTAELANDVTISTSGNIATTGSGTLSVAGTSTLTGNVTAAGNITMADDTSIGISDSAERIEFDGAGDISVLGANLGVGTTSPNLASLTVGMTISGGTSGDAKTAGLDIQGATDSANANFGQLNYYHQADRIGLIAGRRADADNSGALAFYTANAGSLGERLTIAKDGIVSLGNGRSTLTDCQLELKQTGSTDAGLRINSEGTSRQSRLHIRSAANRLNTDTGRILFESGTTTCAVIQAIQGGASNRCGIEFWPANGSSASLKAKVDEGGDFYTNDGSISSLSDSRAKKDVEDLEDGLDLLVQLRPVSFKYNGKTKMNDDDTHYGFIADEVQSIAPQYVKEKSEEFGSWSDGVFTKEEMLTDFKTLSTTRMIPMMLKAIQELSAKVTALENA